MLSVRLAMLLMIIADVCDSSPPENITKNFESTSSSDGYNAIHGFLTSLLFYLGVVYLVWFFIVVPIYMAQFPVMGLIALRYKYTRKEEYKKYEAASNIRGFWEPLRMEVAKYFSRQAKWLHDYELSGVDNIPERPVILAGYHGHYGNDLFYILAELLFQRNIMARIVAHRAFNSMPGSKTFADLIQMETGGIDEIVESIKRGDSMMVFPGGEYECKFSDHNYKVLWGNKLGFAKVALQSKAPIVPFFTENIRQIYITSPFTSVLRILDETIRFIGFGPLFGCYFPVKLITHFGEPIEVDDDMEPEEVRDKVVAAMEELIRKHQRIPGSIWHALKQRYKKPKMPAAK